MSTEHLPPASERDPSAEIVPQKTNLIFFPAMGADFEGVRAIAQSLETALVDGQPIQVLTFNSAVMNFIDPAVAGRQAAIVQAVHDTISRNDRTVLLAHSGGTAVAARALQGVERLSPGLLETKGPKINLVLMGPSGMGKSLRGVFQGVSGGFSLLSDQLNLPLAGFKPSIVGGIETLFWCPPSTISADDLTMELRKLYGEFSHYQEGMFSLAYVPSDTYWRLMSPEDRSAVEGYDKALGKLFANPHRFEFYITGLLKKRAEVLSKYGAKIYNGFPDPARPLKRGIENQPGKKAHPVRDFVREAADVLSGSPAVVLGRQIREFGSSVQLVSGEYDTFARAQYMRRLEAELMSDPPGRLVLERATHAGLKPEDWKRMLELIFDKAS
jgi:hypothetical protein